MQSTFKPSHKRRRTTTAQNDSIFFKVDWSCQLNVPGISKIKWEKRIEGRGRGWGRRRERGRGGRGRKETIKEKIELNREDDKVKEEE